MDLVYPWTVNFDQDFAYCQRFSLTDYATHESGTSMLTTNLKDTVMFCLYRK